MYVNYHTVPDMVLDYVRGQTLLAQECNEVESYAQPDCHWPMHARSVLAAHLVVVAWQRDPAIYRSYFVIQCYAENAPADFYPHDEGQANE